jgi:hypothetical protein
MRRPLALLLAVAGLSLTAIAFAQQPLATCADRLQFLGQALRAYAAANGGSLPADLSALYRDKYVTHELWAFWCPEDRSGQKLPGTISSSGSYELVADRLDTGSREPLLREREACHRMALGDGCCRHILLQNGQVIQQAGDAVKPGVEVVTAPDSPPTIQLTGDQLAVWEPYDAVAYQWTGADDTTPPGELEYRTNFSLTGMSGWTRDTRAVLGRLRPGEHALEVWVRDRAGQVCREPAYLRFRVLPRNPITRLEPIERRMRPLAKAPTQAPPRPVWHEPDSALCRVDIRITDPEEALIRAQREGNGEAAAFVAAEDPGRFQPGQTDFSPLRFERGFPWLHVMLHFRVIPGASRPDCAYELSCQGRKLGQQQIPVIEGDARILHLRIHMTTAAAFGVGRYLLGLSADGRRVCDLAFSVVNPEPAAETRQTTRPALLEGVLLGADKRLSISGDFSRSARPQSAESGLALSSCKARAAN